MVNDYENNLEIYLDTSKIKYNNKIDYSDCIYYDESVKRDLIGGYCLKLKKSAFFPVCGDYCENYITKKQYRKAKLRKILNNG